MHGLGAYRHIEQQVWEHDIRLAERDVPIELLEDDLAVWNVGSDPSANLQRDLFPSGVKQIFLKQHLYCHLGIERSRKCVSFNPIIIIIILWDFRG